MLAICVTASGQGTCSVILSNISISAMHVLQVEDESSAGEVHILHGQVAHLQQELATMTQRLSAADNARAAERCAA